MLSGVAINSSNHPSIPINCLHQQGNLKWSRLYLYSTEETQSHFKTTAVLQQVLSLTQLSPQSKGAEGEMPREAERCSASLPHGQRPLNHNNTAPKAGVRPDPASLRFQEVLQRSPALSLPKSTIQGTPPWATKDRLPTSPLRPWAAQVEGSSELVPHSVVPSELCSSWWVLEPIPQPGEGTEGTSCCHLQARVLCPNGEWGRYTFTQAIRNETAWNVLYSFLSFSVISDT